MKTLIKIFLALALAASAHAQTAVATHAADYGSLNAQPVTPGDVVGPASSTDNAFARWSGTTGKLLQDTSDLTYSTPTMSVPAVFNMAITGGTGVTQMTLSDSAGVWQRGSLVVSTAVSAGVHAVNYRNASGGAAYLTNAMAEGTQGAPTTLGTSVVTGGYLGYAYANANFQEITRIASITSDTFSDTDYSGELRFYTHNTTATGGATLRATLNKWGKLSLSPGTASQTAWTTTGALSSHAGTTITDSSTAVSGTASSAVFHSWAAPTLAATNATVTTTDAFSIYFAGPVTTGTNQTITRPHTLGVVDSTSASSSITGAVVISATLGTTATSVGIGGGNVNAGGTITAGSSITGTFDIYSVQSLSGAGAVNVSSGITEYTSTGGSQALTLANGTAGQVKYIVHGVDGGSGILTPTTKTGYTTITFTNAGDSVTLVYLATRGWVIVGIFGAVAV